MPENRQKKISFRTRMIDAMNGRLARERGFDWMEKEITAKKEKWPNCFVEHYERRPVGNSQWCMLRENFLWLGGMDERFSGWGFEDHEFNLRAFEHFGQTIMHATSELLHLGHSREADWANTATSRATSG